LTKANKISERRPRTAVKRVPRKSDPQATVEALLDAARNVLSRDGAEGLHVTQVARRAGVSRATAYLHFPTRERLMAATAASVSDKLFGAVFDYPAFAPDQPMEAVSVREMIQHLAGFAMDNPELCRIWLHEVLSSERPATDKFWRRYMAAMERFAASELAQEGIDVEVHSILMLAGTFLWPMWAQGQARTARQRQEMVDRFANEMLRLTFNGTLRPDKFEEFRARWNRQESE
jgi:AcrR family transcriptional regulator